MPITFAWDDRFGLVTPIISCDRTDYAPAWQWPLHCWLLKSALILALLLSIGNAAERLPKQTGSTDSIRNLALIATIGARQSVAIVKVDRPSAYAKAPKQFDGVAFPVAAIFTISTWVSLAFISQGASFDLFRRCKAYRARPPPIIVLLPANVMN